MFGISLSALAALAFFAGCTTSAPVQSDAEGPIRGTVLAVDMTPTHYDANGRVTIKASDGDTLVVQIPGGLAPRPERPNECKADATRLANQLQPGDSVEVRGDVRGSDVYICQNPSDFLRRAN